MTARRSFWLLAMAAILAVAALVVPASPVYLPNLLNSGPRFEGKSLNRWLQALQGEDGPEKWRAMFAMGALGSEAAAGVPALAKILVDHPDREYRNQAALALSKMAPASSAAVAELTQALNDGEPFVRMNATRALLLLKKAAAPAVPRLIEELNKKENHTNLATFSYTLQELTARALGRASADTANGVPALTEALKSADTDSLRIAVIHALGDVGLEARPAAPLVRKQLNSPSTAVREAAQEALELIEGKGAAPAKNPEPPGESETSLELPETERSYLWEIEHHGNVLVKHGFAPLAEALARADAAACARLLADDFAGADLGDAQRVQAASAYLDAVRLQAGAKTVSLDRAAFVARLIEQRRVFTAAPPKVKIALMNFAPKVRGQFDGRWSGTALLRMHGESSAGAPAEVTLTLRYDVVRPTVESLAQPGWLRSAAIVQSARALAPGYWFAEVAQERGLNVERCHDNWQATKFAATTGGAYVCDFDRDGILDVLITDLNGATLYRGSLQGAFRNVTTQMGLPVRATGTTVAAWVDIDGDGWEDLLLSGAVFRNDAGKRFIDYTRRCNLKLPFNAGNIFITDYDRDGKLDLYATHTAPPGSLSWLDDRSGDPNGNSLFRNKGNWQFEDVTQASGTSAGRRSTFAAAWLDVNNDGWPDLHVTNEFGDGLLLINQKNGKFREHALADYPADYGTMGMAVGDVNNDGHIDIFCGNMYSKAGTRVISNLAPDAFPPKVMEKIRRFVAGSQLHLNQGDLKFDQAGTRMQVNGVGWSYGACMADLDNDGFLDIYATAGFVSRSRDEPDG